MIRCQHCGSTFIRDERDRWGGVVSYSCTKCGRPVRMVGEDGKSKPVGLSSLRLPPPQDTITTRQKEEKKMEEGKSNSTATYTTVPTQHKDCIVEAMKSAREERNRLTDQATQMSFAIARVRTAIAKLSKFIIACETIQNGGAKKNTGGKKRVETADNDPPALRPIRSTSHWAKIIGIMRDKGAVDDMMSGEVFTVMTTGEILEEYKVRGYRISDVRLHALQLIGGTLRKHPNVFGYNKNNHTYWLKAKKDKEESK